MNRDRAGKAGRILENKRNARFGHALSRHFEGFKICNLRSGDANCNSKAHEDWSDYEGDLARRASLVVSGSDVVDLETKKGLVATWRELLR